MCVNKHFHDLFKSGYIQKLFIIERNKFILIEKLISALDIHRYYSIDFYGDIIFPSYKSYGLARRDANDKTRIDYNNVCKPVIIDRIKKNINQLTLFTIFIDTTDINKFFGRICDRTQIDVKSNKREYIVNTLDVLTNRDLKLDIL